MSDPARACPCAKPSLTPRAETVLLLAIYVMAPTTPEAQARFLNMYAALAVVEAMGPNGASHAEVKSATGMSYNDALRAVTDLEASGAVVIWGGTYYEIVAIPPRDNIVLGYLRGAGNSTVDRIADRVNLPESHVRQALASLGSKVQQGGSFWYATRPT